jgi:SagB-type dehydrogenase family enzyme
MSHSDDVAGGSSALEAVYCYHDATKHHFHRFARSLGYLDWAAQPRPFRTFTDTPAFNLYPAPGTAATHSPRATTFDQACSGDAAAAPLTASAIGDLLRHALGLSAWKRFHASRWSLRVNPSSGNLHPTEAYVIAPALAGLADAPAVYHYAPDRHALELRSVIASAAWHDAWSGRHDIVLVALTSIHWREAWKYGERAFRYCQHDLGHAAAAVAVAAGLLGWQARLLPDWSHQDIAAVTGLNRDEDFIDVEREEPGLIVALSIGPLDCNSGCDAHAMAESIARGRWSGRASQLSEDHVTWSIIDEVATATADPGHRPDAPAFRPRPPAAVVKTNRDTVQTDRAIDGRALVLRRRSALGLDGRSATDRATFIRLLSRLLPGDGAPWEALWWTPRIHLALFVHRVEGVPPGLYMLVRDATALDRLRAACRSEFLWEPIDDCPGLWLLAPLDLRHVSARVSCDQDIAADGFFSLGMVADFDRSLQLFGPSFYRHLFWETGTIGQVLYLEAEAAGARGTGIGCFYDDGVHDVLGLRGHGFQSLYHFTVGMPIEDARLTTEPGYSWPS